MVKKRTVPAWVKVISIIAGIILLLSILLVFLFDPKTGYYGGVRQADTFMENICFDKQYLNDFKSNPSDFLSNIYSYAVSVYRVEITVDKRRYSEHNITANTYFAIRENGTLKEVAQDEVDPFLDSYCEDCLACYSLDSWEPLFKENGSTIWDYKTEGYFSIMDNNGEWYYYDTPQPRNLSYFLMNHTIEGTKLN